MKGIRLAVLAIACGLASPQQVLASEAPISRGMEDPGIYAELVAMLEKEVGTRLTSHLQQRGILRQVTVGIVIEPRKPRMVVDFGPGYLPGKEQSYGELFLIPLAADLRRYSERCGLELLDVEFFFQGRPMKQHFPDDHPQPALVKRRTVHSKALVLSSHGYVWYRVDRLKRSS